MRAKRRSRCRAKSQRTGYLWIPLVVPLHHYRITAGFWRLCLASGLLVAAGFLAAGRRVLLMAVAHVPLRRYGLAVDFWLRAAGGRWLLMDFALLPLQGYVADAASRYWLLATDSSGVIWAILPLQGSTLR